MEHPISYLSTTLNLSSIQFLNGSKYGQLCFVNDPVVTRVFRVMAYVAVILISLLGNTMTVIIVAKKNKRRNCARLFLANLAVADLTITIFYMTRMVVRMFYGSRWLLDGILGLVSCRLVSFLHHTSILVSVCSVFLVTLDRFCAVIFPLRRIMTKRVAATSLVSSWILAGMLRLPYLISSEIQPSRKYQLVCLSRLKIVLGNYFSHYLHTLVGVYCFFLVLTICLYVLIISRLCLEKAPGDATQATMSRQKAGRKLLKMLISITVAYILCWILYFLAVPIYGSDKLPCELTFFRLFLAHSNSAINPCLLALFDTTFRDGFKVLLKRLFCLRCLGSGSLDNGVVLNISTKYMRRNTGMSRNEGSSERQESKF